MNTEQDIILEMIERALDLIDTKRDHIKINVRKLGGESNNGNIIIQLADCEEILNDLKSDLLKAGNKDTKISFIEKSLYAVYAKLLMISPE